MIIDLTLKKKPLTSSLKGIDIRFRTEHELFLNLSFQAHLKQCVALLDDFKDGTLPPGTTDKQVKQPKHDYTLSTFRTGHYCNYLIHSRILSNEPY